MLIANSGASYSGSHERILIAVPLLSYVSFAEAIISFTQEKSSLPVAFRGDSARDSTLAVAFSCSYVGSYR